MTTSLPQKTMSVKDAAEELQVCVKTIRRRIADKEIVAIKSGNIVRIERKEWIKFLERNTSCAGT